MQSQQAKIDELQKQVITQGQNFNDQTQKLKDVEHLNQKLQAMVYGLKRVQNNLELEAEDAECVSMSLDDQGVAKCDDDGNPYSLWGRVCQFKKISNVTEDELQARIDEALKLVQKDCIEYGVSDFLEKAMDILKGNKDEN